MSQITCNMLTLSCLTDLLSEGGTNPPGPHRCPAHCLAVLHSAGQAPAARGDPPNATEAHDERPTHAGPGGYSDQAPGYEAWQSHVGSDMVRLLSREPTAASRSDEGGRHVPRAHDSSGSYLTVAASIAGLPETTVVMDTGQLTLQGNHVVPAISARGITRRFPGVLANDGISFDVLPGEIHGLLGENGSGKTTLCKILTGLYRPDAGEILLDGKPVDFGSPRDGYAAGVFMVQQHFSLVDRLTVAENVVLGWTRRRYVRFDATAVEAEVAATAEEFHIRLNPRALVWQLSVGEQQRVEILKALYRRARILILDEPTTVLTPQECEDLFRSLRRMAASGSSIILISHKLRDVLEICDTVTILRRGRTVGDFSVKDEVVDPAHLARLMVGHDVPLAPNRRPARSAHQEIVLDVADITVRNDFGRVRIKELSLAVRKGEILGIAGVAGNGQRELAEAISGIRPYDSGVVTVMGRGLPGGDPRAAIRAGVAYVPEDRLGTGLVPSLRVADNLILKDFASRQFSRGPLVRWRKVSAHARHLLERFDVRSKPDSLVRQLSGGNAQKVVLAREMSSDPSVMVVASPTRGLDVAATQNVRSLLLESAERGVGILMISEDLDEVLEIADRVAVMYDGRIMAVVDPRTAEREDIGLLAAGIEGKS